MRIALGLLFSIYILNNIFINPCFQAVAFPLCFYSHHSSSKHWTVFFLISPSELFWIFALLLIEKSTMFHCTTVYQSLYTTFSWFCSFHSASIPEGLSSSHRIPPVHYSFQHSSIPSPTYTTICSAIPQLKGRPSFSSFFATIKSTAKNIFAQVFFLMISLGFKPSNIVAGTKGRQFLVHFVHSSKLPSRMVGSVHNSTTNASISQCYHIHSNIHYPPLLSL